MPARKEWFISVKRLRSKFFHEFFKQNLKLFFCSALKKDKYYFVESAVKHMFGFPTYIVTKLYEEYHEDHLVVENNLNMSGGLFKSPNTTPKHDSKVRQTNPQQRHHKGIGNGGRAGKAERGGQATNPPVKKAPPPAAEHKHPSNANYARRDISVPIIEIETFE